MPNRRSLLAGGTALMIVLWPQALYAAPRRDREADEPAPRAAAAAPSTGDAARAPATRDDEGDDDDDDARAPSEIVVTARRLDLARAGIVPSLGASAYALPNDVVEARPGGEAASLRHVILQLPGVSQAGSGELRVRTQANLQYRINNVVVPEGFSDFADTLRARFAENVRLVRGALPAQYGLQTGGVVDITTKSGAYQRGGEVELNGGSHGRREAAFEAAGGVGDTNVYTSGSYARDGAGLQSLDGAAHPSHDRSDEADAFLFVDHIIDAQSRVSFVAGLSSDRNQLPTLDEPALAALAQSPGASTRVDFGGDQRNQTAYAMVTYQRTGGRLTYQASASVRYATLRIGPGPVAVSPATGSAAAVDNQGAGGGVQVDGVYDAGGGHKLRAGLLANVGREASEASYLAPGDGAQPLMLAARSVEHRSETSAYVQDEWRPWDALTVNFGLRFDRVSGDGAGSQVGPRLNAVWQVAAATTLHAGYARYLTPAPQDGLPGWPPSPANASSASGAARAETDNDYDVGLEQAFDALKLGVDAYWRDATNLLDELRIGSTALRQSFNFAEGRARGVEAYATYAEGPFSAWANVAWARTEGRRIVSGQAAFTSDELAAAARFLPTNDDQRVTASFGSSYRWRALRLSVDAICGSGLPRTGIGETANDARMPGYVQVNASAVYRLDGLRDRPLDLRVDVINVFDDRYALQDGTSLAGGFPQWGPRRGVFLGLEQQF